MPFERISDILIASRQFRWTNFGQPDFLPVRLHYLNNATASGSITIRQKADETAINTWRLFTERPKLKQ
jgi:hypothetical protein